MSKSKKNRYVVCIHFVDKSSYIAKFTETDNLTVCQNLARMLSNGFNVWYTEVEEVKSANVKE